MTAYDGGSDIATPIIPPIWVCLLLGVVMIAAGVFALSDAAFATIVSVKLIGMTAIAAGAFEIAHALWTRGWGGLLWQILLGALYLAFGCILLAQPDSGAIVLTRILGAFLLASGIIRCILSFAYWQQSGWMMLASAGVGLAASALILLGTPAISAWLLGVLLGVDLISHGLAWLLYAFHSTRDAA